MSARPVPRSIASCLLFLPCLGLGAGCGSNLPENGTTVQVIDPVKAAEQGKSTADYYKAHPEAIQRGTGRR